MIMAEIYEHTIHLFLREHGGSALKKGIYYSLGSDADSKSLERFRLVVVDGERSKNQMKSS